MADDAPGSGADPTASDAPDPAISYPRGNRLGIRHPRPTVVIVVAVLVVLAGAFAWQQLRPAPATMCELTGAVDSPTADSAEGAFTAWWEQAYGSGAPARSGAAPDPAPTPALDDFERSGSQWDWAYADGRLLRVEVGESNGTYAVASANDCTVVRA